MFLAQIQNHHRPWSMFTVPVCCSVAKLFKRNKKKYDLKNAGTWDF